MIRCPLVLPLLVCTTLLLSGALSRQGVAPALGGARDAPPDPGLPGAADLLAEAVALLAPDRLPWLETAVRQQVQGPDGNFVARGRLLTAPGRRQRLELTVRVGKTEGTLLVVCDGRTVRQTLRVGHNEPLVFQRDLGAAAAEPIPADVGTAGLDQLLAGIRRHLAGAKVQRASWRGQPVLRVRGDWQADPPRPGELLPGMRPPEPPQTCTVLLDARTLWPLRVAWATAGERQTWQVEFRDPQRNQPLAPDRCAALFAVPAAVP